MVNRCLPLLFHVHDRWHILVWQFDAIVAVVQQKVVRPVQLGKLHEQKKLLRKTLCVTIEQ
jgi:hypothetical protein